MATTAVWSAKVVVIDSGEVGRSSVYNIYNNGPRALPCGGPAHHSPLNTRVLLSLT
jgi:hypothetical protein